MKKILLMSFCLFVTTAIAQELFPELAGLGKRTPASSQTQQKNEQKLQPTTAKEGIEVTESVTQEEEIVIPDTTQAEILNIDETTATPSAVLSAKTEEATASDEDEDENNDEKIQIYITDVDATIVPNNNFSYCFGKIKFSTTTKRPVQQLDVDITYGPYPNTYNIRNLVAGQEQTKEITLVGQVCEHIIDMPEFTVKRCVIERMDEAQCIKKVEFIPLRGA